MDSERDANVADKGRKVGSAKKGEPMFVLSNRSAMLSQEEEMKVEDIEEEHKNARIIITKGKGTNILRKSERKKDQVIESDNSGDELSGSSQSARNKNQVPQFMSTVSGGLPEPARKIEKLDVSQIRRREGNSKASADSGSEKSEPSSHSKISESLPSVEQILDKQYSGSQIKSAFDAFDLSHKGLIRPIDLRLLLNSLGEHATDEEIDEMVRIFDTTGEGVVRFEEFSNKLLGDTGTPQEEIKQDIQLEEGDKVERMHSDNYRPPILSRAMTKQNVFGPSQIDRVSSSKLEVMNEEYKFE